MGLVFLFLSSYTNALNSYALNYSINYCFTEACLWFKNE